MRAHEVDDLAYALLLEPVADIDKHDGGDPIGMHVAERRSRSDPPSDAPTNATRRMPNSSSSGGIVSAMPIGPKPSTNASESPWFGRSGAST